MACGWLRVRVDLVEGQRRTPVAFALWCSEAGDGRGYLGHQSATS